MPPVTLAQNQPMRFVLAITAAALLAGCGQVDVTIDESKLVAPPPNADAAIAMTCEAFGISAPPQIWFYAADRERCDSTTFFYDGSCYGGLQGANGILMVVQDDAVTASDTPIVHELGHWKWDDGAHSNATIWGGTGTWLDQRSAGYRIGDQYLELRAAGL